MLHNCHKYKYEYLPPKLNLPSISDNPLQEYSRYVKFNERQERFRRKDRLMITPYWSSKSIEHITLLGGNGTPVAPGQCIVKGFAQVYPITWMLSIKRSLIEILRWVYSL